MDIKEFLESGKYDQAENEAGKRYDIRVYVTLTASGGRSSYILFLIA